MRVYRREDFIKLPDGTFYEISKRVDSFTNLITTVIISICCYYLGDMVVYKYLGNLS